MHKYTVLVATTLLALAGCQQESGQPPSAPSQTAQPQTAQAPSDQVTAAVSNPAISVTPGTLQNCDGSVATVHWDASKAGASTASTEIWVGSSNADAKLFSAGGNTGEAKTDAWTRPGTHFFLKNKEDGKELGQVVVGGPACQQP
ncbi:MAG: hypothetical protein EPN49_00500 [Rhodanobacter sp.]|nr:MAG: hypothetical protein EPN49_00500 [Rhodanobacter sp.]